MAYGYRYDPYDPGWGGRAQPGVVNVRDVLMDLIPELEDYGILRDKSRCNKLSAHCHGRAWDAKILPQYVLTGDRLAQFFVDAAEDIGTQRVIWGFGPSRPPKEWDSRPGQRYWSSYSGHHHDDHVHAEWCWEAARTLTKTQVRAAFQKYWPTAEEDWFEMASKEDLREVVQEELAKLIGKTYYSGGTVLAILTEKDGDKYEDGIKAVRRDIKEVKDLVSGG